VNFKIPIWLWLLVGGVVGLLLCKFVLPIRGARMTDGQNKTAIGNALGGDAMPNFRYQPATAKRNGDPGKSWVRVFEPILPNTRPPIEQEIIKKPEVTTPFTFLHWGIP
jgi:hypothetical protein